jgi:chemotaxis protein CheD
MLINEELDESKYEYVEIISGEYFISNKPNQLLATLLGSCISVCIRDSKLKIGGMNHFMLPGDEGDSEESHHNSARYGLFSMEKMLNELFKNGAQKDRLEVKIFGGADINENSQSVGKLNIDFIKGFLNRDGYKIASEDVGGNKARKIHYFPSTGKVMMKLISKDDNENKNIIQKERAYRLSVQSSPIGGEVDLF